MIKTIILVLTIIIIYIPICQYSDKINELSTAVNKDNW